MSTKKSAKPKKTGELALIERIRALAGSGAPEVRLGIGDDCAILLPRAGEEIVVTTDMSLQGRHFRRDWHPAASVGHRALARGLSDIAAMGARPVAAFLSMALPKSVAEDDRWVDGFLDGLLALAKDHGITLAGGDTGEAPGQAVMADIVVLGAAPAGTALRRSGAKVGDDLYCTGWLGGSMQELLQIELGPEWYRGAKRGEGRYPHLYPEPRVAVGMALRERGLATACIDLSDGLSTDLAHLCTASGVGAEVDLNALPEDPRLRSADAQFTNRCVLHGGEDYELLFTAAPGAKVPKRMLGAKVTRIGKIVARRKKWPQVMLVGSDGYRRALVPAGWEHLT